MPLLTLKDKKQLDKCQAQCPECDAIDKCRIPGKLQRLAKCSPAEMRTL